MFKVVNAIYPGITTTELDTLTSEIAISMSDDHPDYALLAARIAISNLQKQTKKHFSGKDFELPLLFIFIYLNIFQIHILIYIILCPKLVLHLPPEPAIDRGMVKWALF